MIDLHEIDTLGRIFGINCKRLVAQSNGHVEEGSRVNANLGNAYFADPPDGKRATIRNAGVAIVV